MVLLRLLAVLLLFVVFFAISVPERCPRRLRAHEGRLSFTFAVLAASVVHGSWLRWGMVICALVCFPGAVHEQRTGQVAPTWQDWFRARRERRSATR